MPYNPANFYNVPQFLDTVQRGEALVVSDFDETISRQFIFGVWCSNGVVIRRDIPMSDVEWGNVWPFLPKSDGDALDEALIRAGMEARTNDPDFIDHLRKHLSHDRNMNPLPANVSERERAAEADAVIDDMRQRIQGPLADWTPFDMMHLFQYWWLAQAPIQFDPTGEKDNFRAFFEDIQPRLFFNCLPDYLADDVYLPRSMAGQPMCDETMHALGVYAARHMIDHGIEHYLYPDQLFFLAEEVFGRRREYPTHLEEVRDQGPVGLEGDPARILIATASPGAFVQGFWDALLPWFAAHIQFGDSEVTYRAEAGVLDMNHPEWGVQGRLRNQYDVVDSVIIPDGLFSVVGTRYVYDADHTAEQGPERALHEYKNDFIRDLKRRGAVIRVGMGDSPASSDRELTEQAQLAVRMRKGHAYDDVSEAPPAEDLRALWQNGAGEVADPALADIDRMLLDSGFHYDGVRWSKA